MDSKKELDMDGNVHLSDIFHKLEGDQGDCEIYVSRDALAILVEDVNALRLYSIPKGLPDILSPLGPVVFWTPFGTATIRLRPA